MANRLNSGSPLHLDTVFNPGASAPSVIPTKALYVSKIVFNAANAGDAYQICHGRTGTPLVSNQAGPGNSGGGIQQDFPEGVLTLNPHDGGWYLSILTAGDSIDIYYTEIGV